MTIRYAALLLAVVAALSDSVGCAALSKGTPRTVQFFTLERAHDGGRAPPGADKPARSLRLGRVTGAPHLEAKLVFRTTTNEVGYRPELRWTEPPEMFLRRALTHVLFEDRGYAHAVSGASAILDVQLIALDEIVAEPRLARVRVKATLRTDITVLWEETLTVDRPIVEAPGSEGPLATVAALGDALDAVIEVIADRVSDTPSRSR